MNIKTTKKRGFTLIELLIVIGILSSMAAIVLSATSDARSKGRDAQRVSQIRQVQLAVEVYYSNHGQYPSMHSTDVEQNWSDLLDLLHNEKLIAAAPAVPPVQLTFLEKVAAFFEPTTAYALNTKIQDPLYPTQSYGYMPGDTPLPFQNFRIRAKLENLGNPVLRNAFSGKFLYTDSDPVSWPSDPQEQCAPLAGYYCIGPQQTSSSGFTAFEPGKPVVYLYPTHRMPVSVKVSPLEVQESIPDYGNGWNVIADPDGTITVPGSEQTYPYLFWEGRSTAPIVDRSQGFVVKTPEIAGFLADALAKQGLNEHEYSEFVDYWAPRLTTDKPYVYVYFMPRADYDKIVPMDISPKPDTEIRVYMLWKALDRPIDVAPQDLKAPERTGFTVVEWGGDRQQLP